MEVDLAKPIPNTKAVLYIMINDFLLNMDYKESFNKIGADAVNRLDQFTRSAATFSPLELSDISNPKRPFPRDCENSNFQCDMKDFGHAFFQIEGKDVTMKRIDDMCKTVSVPFEFGINIQFNQKDKNIL